MIYIRKMAESTLGINDHPSGQIKTSETVKWRWWVPQGTMGGWECLRNDKMCHRVPRSLHIATGHELCSC